jgi:hypothetical protein
MPGYPGKALNGGDYKMKEALRAILYCRDEEKQGFGKFSCPFFGPMCLVF